MAKITNIDHEKKHVTFITDDGVEQTACDIYRNTPEETKAAFEAYVLAYTPPVIEVVPSKEEIKNFDAIINVDFDKEAYLAKIEEERLAAEEAARLAAEKLLEQPIEDTVEPVEEVVVESVSESVLETPIDEVPQTAEDPIGEIPPTEEVITP